MSQKWATPKDIPELGFIMQPAYGSAEDDSPTEDDVSSQKGWYRSVVLATKSCTLRNAMLSVHVLYDIFGPYAGCDGG
jgi:hypothetical protein